MLGSRPRWQLAAVTPELTLVWAVLMLFVRALCAAVPGSLDWCIDVTCALNLRMLSPM